jgi:hypothetical protein
MNKIFIIVIIGLVSLCPVRASTPKGELGSDIVTDSTNNLQNAIVQTRPTIRDDGLTDEDHEKLRELRKEAMTHPKVQEALNKVRGAINPKDKDQAIAELKQVVRTYVSAKEERLKTILLEQNKHEPLLSNGQQRKIGQIYEKVATDPEVKQAMRDISTARTNKDKEEAVLKLRELIKNKMSEEDKAYISDMSKDKAVEKKVEHDQLQKQ